MTNEEVHKELFDRVNALERGQSETNGYLKAVVEQNEKYIKLVWRVIIILAFITIASLFALIWGACGADGFKTIRETLPKIPVAYWNEALPVLYDDWGLC